MKTNSILTLLMGASILASHFYPVRVVAVVAYSIVPFLIVTGAMEMYRAHRDRAAATAYAVGAFAMVTIGGIAYYYGFRA